MEHPPRKPSKADGRTAQRRDDKAEPRLPHERDQSADDQGALPTDLGRQAQADVERGMQDTDRGPVMDRAYARQKRPASRG